MIISARHIKTTFLTAVAAVMALPAVGQDKLASMAPVDKKMRAIDSVAIQHLIQNEEIFDMPASALYPEWNNEYTTRYAVAIPSEYRIDLRHFCMPTDSRLVTSHYGYRRSFRRMHYGTDIKVYVGDTIRAAFSGKVRIVANQGRRVGYGQYIMIRHANGLETLYGHLSKQLVKEDQIVKAGQPIGLGGNTGRSYGSHLHFETRFLGQFINPETMFNFEAQDVLGDFYMFRANGKGILLAADNMEGGESEMAEQQMIALADQQAAKQEESRAFQQQRMDAQKQKRATAIHKVKQGDTLSSIAKARRTTVDRLCQLNGIKRTTTLRIGQLLKCS